MFPWWGWAIGACRRSMVSLVVENLCLRQQLLVLRRRQLRPRLSDSDRRFWILASRWFPSWRDILVVNAATVLRWHRRGWKAYWRRRSRRGREAGRRRYRPSSSAWPERTDCGDSEGSKRNWQGSGSKSLPEPSPSTCIVPITRDRHRAGGHS